MSKPEGQLIAFNIYPEKGRSRLFYRVRVFRSERTLRRYLRADKTLHSSLGHRGRAMCRSWTRIEIPKRGPRRMMPDMGEILIPKRHLTSGVITHECTHAVVSWADRIRLNPLDGHRLQGYRNASAAEERFCYGLGEMVRQLVNRCYQAKLIV